MDDSRRDDPPIKVVDRRWWARGENGGEAAAEEAIRKPTIVEDLEQQLADARARVQELMTGHRQALDEFEQVKVRIRRDVGREVERGRRTVLVDLLDVLDNLERALAAARQAGGSGDPLVRGVELVRDQFLSKLEGFGVRRVPALGQPFDALAHEAVTTTPVTDHASDGLVVAVVRDGYAIGEEILRPAGVVVGRHEH